MYVAASARESVSKMDALNCINCGIRLREMAQSTKRHTHITHTHARFSISEQFIDKNESGRKLHLRQSVVTLNDPNVARISVNNTCDKFRFTENVL